MLLLLCSTAAFKKTSFQTYFNQVSLGFRHSMVNTLAQTRGEKKKRKKRGTTACSRNLEKGDHSLQQESWNLSR
jgi:ribosome assembly protein YihI (activator of Der GTPase)